MNWRWSRIIICTIIGLVAGAFTLVQTPIDLPLKIFLMIVVCPIAINCCYWGWKSGKDKIENLSINNFIFSFILKSTFACFVGYFAFPIAVVKAIKNVD